MERINKKIHLGFIVYGKSTAKYLPYFLPSLKAQTLKPAKILAVDNGGPGESENYDYLKNNFPEIEIERPEKNLGFAKAFNLMINRAISAGVDYFLALNPDMTLKPDMLENLARAMEAGEKIAAVQPKILKWDFADNKKTDLIDSLGLSISRDHRFFDARQGERDDAEVNNEKEIFGFTGAAVLLNLKALRDAAFDNGKYSEYFDELMFMYKEDCDLSYRLRLAGWKIILAPRAIAYHDRSAAALGRSDWQIALNRSFKSRAVKRWAFLNQLILLIKLKDLPFSRRVRSATAWYEFKSLVFALVFEPYLLVQLIRLLGLRAQVSDRREQMKIRVSLEQIEKFMV